MMSARPRTRAVRAVLEPLERRILLTWIGATTGTTDDAAHLYNNTANWAGGVIDNSFAGVTLTGATTLYFNAGLTTGAGGLNLGYSGNYNLTLESSSATAQTLTLAGGISGTFGGSSVTIGDPSNNLNVDLGPTGQTFTISASNTLSILNVISDTGGLTEAGAGTLTLSGANTFSGGMTLSAGQLNINSAAAIGTGTLTLDGGTIDNTSGSTVSLSNNNAQTWAGSFTFNGTNALNLGTGAVTLGASIQLTTNASNLTVGGNIGDGGNTYSLKKSGASGTLTLSGNNTFSGGMTFTSGSTAGYLNVDSATALGLGTFTINSGTTLDNTSSGSITVSNIAGIYWGGNFTFAGTHDLNFGTFAVTMSSSHTVTLTAGTLAFGGVISGVGAAKLSIAGNGALILSGANTYTGGMSINSGTLDINNASALGAGGTITLHGGTIDNTSSGSITVSTANPISVGADFTFRGTEPLNLGTGAVSVSTNRTLTVSGSTLTLGGAITGNHSLTKLGNGTLVLTGASGGTFTGGGVILDAGTLDINNATALGTARFTINGGTFDNTSGSAITLSTNNAQTWGADFTFGGTNSLNLGTGAVTMGASIQLTTTAGNLTVGGNIADLSNGYGITKAGAGTLVLSGSNTFGGGITLSAGTLDINSAAAVGTGTFTINGGTIDNTGGSAVTLSNNNVQTWGGDFAFAGSNALNLGTGAVTLGASRAVTIQASTLTVGGNVGDGSSGYGITKAGAGTLVLNGADTYSGTTTINGGVVQLGNANAAQDSTVSVGTNNGLAFSAGIGSFTMGGLAGGSNEALTDTSAGAVTLSVGNNGSSNVYSGKLSGSGALAIIGGTQTLSGSNTFSGGITVAPAASGQLNINSAGALGTGTLTIDGGAIDNTSGSPVTVSNNNAQAWNGSFTFEGTNPLDLGTGAVTLGTSPILEVDGTLTVGGNIGDEGHGYGFTMSGTGALTLSGSSTFSGGVTLSEGQLNINSAGAIGTGTFTIDDDTGIDNTSGHAVTLSTNNAQAWGGSFSFAGSNDLNLGTGAVTLGASGIVLDTYISNLTVGGNIGDGGHGYGITESGDGSGYLTLSGSSTFSGGVTVEEGQLNINSGGAIGTGTLTIDAGTSIDNTSGLPITLSNNNAQTWNGDFDFQGSNPLNLGTGAVTLGASDTVYVDGSTLTVGGNIGDGGHGYGITASDEGTLVLSGSSTFSGGMTLEWGALDINSGGAIGTGTLTIDEETSIDNTSSSAVTLSKTTPRPGTATSPSSEAIR